MFIIMSLREENYLHYEIMVSQIVTISYIKMNIRSILI